MKSKSITFSNRTPLFLKAVYTKTEVDPTTGKEINKDVRDRITSNLIQKMMREIAHRSPLVDEGNNGRDFNPLGPHALRESFGSIMVNKGIPDSVVDFWLGHSIGEMAQAYKSVQASELKRMYPEREIFISVGAPDTEIEQRLKREISQQFQDSREELQSTVTKETTVFKRYEEWKS